MTILNTISEWLLSNGGPLTSGISGIFAVFSENKTGRLWKVLPIIGVIGGMFWALASANFADRQQREQMEGAINRVNDYVEKQSQNTVAEVNTNTRAALADFLQKSLGVLPVVAANVTPQSAAEIVNASLLVHKPPPDRRAVLTIRVFPHVEQEVDFNVVLARLREVADHVEVRKPLVNEADVGANSVWWSDGSSLEEAKSVALIATSAGLHISQVCPSNRVQLRNLIQIGGSVSVQRQQMPVLSGPEIEALSEPKCEKGSQ